MGSLSQLNSQLMYFYSAGTATGGTDSRIPEYEGNR